MATGNPIILGGGIGKGTPFTLGALLMVANVTPPTAADSIAFQRTQSATTVITIGANSFPLATEKLQVVGGLISDTGAHDNVIIGRGVTAPALANGNNVVIGTGSQAPTVAGATFNTIVGAGNSFAGITSIGSCTIVGASNTFGVSFPSTTTIVGSGNTWNNAFAGPGIGIGSSWQGSGVGIGNQQAIAAVNNWVAIGRSVQVNANGQTAVGDNARPVAGHTNAIALGRNAVSVAAASLNVGATGGAQIDTVLIGAGDTQVGGQNITYRSTNGSGNNDPAAVMTMVAPLGTGNAVAGGFTVQVGIAGASGATLQTATQALRIEGGTGNIALGSTSSFGSGVGVVFIHNAATNPTTNPAAGGILYVNAGALTYRGSGGTVTVIAPA